MSEYGSKIKNILIGVTGSISAYKANDLASALSHSGYNVKGVFTTSASKITQPTTFGAITHTKPYVDENWFSDVEEVSHIALAKWADLIIVYPASANTIAKLVNGFSDNILTSTVLAFEGMNSGKIIAAPAMNNFMYEAKPTQKNLETLKSMGFEIIEPIVGNLACGDSGKGHIAKVNDVVNFIKNL